MWRRGVSAELDEPGELFGPELLAHEMAEEGLVGRPSVRDGEIGGRSEAEMRRRLAELGDDGFVDVVENFGIADYGEERDAAVARFRRTFRSLGWSPVAQRLVDGNDRVGGGAAIHVRAGDIVTGGWRQFLVHEKYVPTPYVEAAAARLGADGRPVVVASDHPAYAAWLGEKHGTVPPAARVPGYAELTAVQRALADVLVLSRCATVAAAGWSAFSRLAVNVGGGELVRPDTLVSAGSE